MERIGKLMNSKPHLVGRVEQKLIYGPADIEVHTGNDGRTYLVDFARYCPPEPPVPGRRGANLYRLLRPELVKKFSKPLSSDAFSNIGIHDSALHNEEVKEAYEYLLNTVIHDCAKEVSSLCGSSSNTDQHFTDVVSCLHKYGINIRHLGHVRNSPEISEERARFSN